MSRSSIRSPPSPCRSKNDPAEDQSDRIPPVLEQPVRPVSQRVDRNRSMRAVRHVFQLSGEHIAEAQPEQNAVALLDIQRVVVRAIERMPVVAVTLQRVQLEYPDRSTASAPRSRVTSPSTAIVSTSPSQPYSTYSRNRSGTTSSSRARSVPIPYRARKYSSPRSSRRYSSDSYRLRRSFFCVLSAWVSLGEGQAARRGRRAPACRSVCRPGPTASGRRCRRPSCRERR